MSSKEEEQTLSKHPRFIGKRDDVIQAGRVVASVNGRDVLVLYRQGAFYALDVRCYREFLILEAPCKKEILRSLLGVCASCAPGTSIRFTLNEGEGMYQAVNPSVNPPTPVWCSKGVKQRVHRVTEARGGLVCHFGRFYHTHRI